MSKKYKMLDGEGLFSIAKVSGRDSNRCVRITVEDDASHLRIIEICVSLEQFSEALMGLANQECSFKLNQNTNIGLRREHKKEFVAFDGRYLRSDEMESNIETALIQFEVDGWTGNRGDLGDFNKRGHVDGIEGYNVSFERWVK